MSKPTTKKTSSDRALARLRLDARLEPLRKNLAMTAVPKGGWLRAMRQALGMTLEDVAVRLGVSHSTAARIESSEQRETIQLDTLRRAAEAVHCQLAYVLIPKAPLDELVQTQKLKLARESTARVLTHMALEGQETNEANLEQWRQDHAIALVSDRNLWKTDR